MTTREGRRRRHRRHKRKAATSGYWRATRMRLGYPVIDDPLTLTEVVCRQQDRMLGLRRVAAWLAAECDVLRDIAFAPQQGPYRFETRTSLPPGAEDIGDLDEDLSTDD